ncbi:MAG: hypothetical protein ACLR8P_12860 [Clostridium fessum]
MDVIEYELPEWERAENGAEEAPADRQEKRTVERENAGKHTERQKKRKLPRKSICI